MSRTRLLLVPLAALATLGTAACGPSSSEPASSAAAPEFEIMETRIADIHAAIKAGTLTTTQLVEQYLTRIKTYNGACVKEPNGLLGRIETIAHAGQINALSTLNLRPAARHPELVDGKDQIELFLDLAFAPETVPDDLTKVSAST